ncbi:putative pectinesterase 11 [Bienertia sinuspersici]
MATIQGSYFSMIIFFVIAFCSIINSTNARLTWKRLIVVDQSGEGQYRKIQDAIDAVPNNNVDSTLILVKPGTYKEKVTVPEDKPFIILSGRNAFNTTVTWDDNGDIHTSPTLSNTYGEGAQAVALRVSSDRAEFYACRIISYQDTLLDERGSHFYSNCYIEGGTDFICGNAASVFQKCTIHSVSHHNGAITAQRRTKSEENTGFYFIDCKVTGIKSCTLGRPWGPYSRVVFIGTYMSNAVNPHGWDDWGKSTTHSSVYYGEYKCYGPGANREKRVGWSQSLTKHEATNVVTKAVTSVKSRVRV